MKRLANRRRILWWGTHLVLPLAALIALSSRLAHSNFDLESLRPFYDSSFGAFPLRHEWFFDGVLHVAGRGLVAIATAGLAVGAAMGWSRPRWRDQARMAAFVSASVVLAVAIAWAWSTLAPATPPWDTSSFGGSLPWPLVRGPVGSPSVHAASGFALVSLYFVGASLGVRLRWTWLAPGLLLGFVFALGEHVRGAHPPSRGVLSLAIAWATACSLACAFRRSGWLGWQERDDERTTAGVPAGNAERVMPWLAGAILALSGAAFFAMDELVSLMKAQNEELHQGFEVVELVVMAGGLGLGGWLFVDRIASLRIRSARRLQEEQERRLQILGKMAASVAHEVRNPLQSMRLIVDEQRIDIPALNAHPLRDEFEGCFDRIDRAVDLVYRLARPGTEETEQADLASCARDSIASLERLSERCLPFRWLASATAANVRASRFDVRLVVDNLLRNAVEASPPGEAISLDLRRGDGGWALRIENTGRLDKRAQDEEAHRGLGLGMAISRHVVEGARGSLEIEQVGDRVRSVLRFPAADEVPDDD